MYWQIIVLNILELAACITGFVYWKKIKNIYWRWFPVYLGIIVLTELSAEYFLNVKHNLRINISIYEFFGVPLEFLFFFWLFYRYFGETKKNQWPLYLGLIYFGCWFFDVVYLSKQKLYFESISYIVGNILLLIILLMFFIKFSKGDEILKYKSSMIFWVSLGLMIFYIGTLPFYGFRTILYRQDRDFFYVYWYIQFGLNYLMYILFVLSFVWGKPK